MADNSGSYVGQLDETFPDGDVDKVLSLDDAVRKTRDVVKDSFPNITGAVTKTHTELNAILAALNVPHLVHSVSAAVAAGAVIQEVTLDVGCNYEITGSGLQGSSATNAEIAIQVGDGSGFETGNDYGYIENLVGTSGSPDDNADTAHDGMRIVSFDNKEKYFAFWTKLTISEADANSTAALSLVAGEFVLLKHGAVVSFCDDSAKTTLTRFRVINTGSGAIASGRIFIKKEPKTVYS